MQGIRQPPLDENSINSLLKGGTGGQFGVLDYRFLMQSVGTVMHDSPICVRGMQSVAEVLELMMGKKIGSVLVTAETGELEGIFTERDFLKHLAILPAPEREKPISEFMTKDPVSCAPDVSIAFALNLMSHGGFRHIPIVDERRTPIGVVSVRDMIDYIVHRFVDDLLNIETPSS